MISHEFDYESTWEFEYEKPRVCDLKMNMRNHVFAIWEYWHGLTKRLLLFVWNMTVVCTLGVSKVIRKHITRIRLWVHVRIRIWKTTCLRFENKYEKPRVCDLRTYLVNLSREFEDEKSRVCVSRIYLANLNSTMRNHVMITHWVTPKHTNPQNECFENFNRHLNEFA